MDPSGDVTSVLKKEASIIWKGKRKCSPIALSEILSSSNLLYNIFDSLEHVYVLWHQR